MDAQTRERCGGYRLQMNAEIVWMNSDLRKTEQLTIPFGKQQYNFNSIVWFALLRYGYNDSAHDELVKLRFGVEQGEMTFMSIFIFSFFLFSLHTVFTRDHNKQSRNRNKSLYEKTACWTGTIRNISLYLSFCFFFLKGLFRLFIQRKKWGSFISSFSLVLILCLIVDLFMWTVEALMLIFCSFSRNSVARGNPWG